MKIILASASPRRKELLDLIKVNYEVIVSNADEEINENNSIEEESKKLSYKKAKEVFERTSGDRIIISGDTLVIKDKKIYGKPKDEHDAIRMIEELKNGTHQVITSFAILCYKEGEYKEYLDYDIAEIYLKDITKEEILKWVNDGNALDKAGAYAIQSEFAVHVEKIVGNYTTVVGLPIHKVYDILKECR